MTLKFREIIVLILVVFTITMAYFVINKKNRQQENNNKIKSVSMVTDSSDFYDVEGIVSQYVALINNDNKEDLMKVLDNQYIKENNVSVNNVVNKLQVKAGILYSFEALEMYYKNLNASITKFFVHGYLSENSLSGNINQSDFYVIVLVDSNKSLFSIIPDNGSLFKEVAK